MHPESSIFRPYNPLIESDPLFIQVAGNSDPVELRLRPVCLISDLEIIHQWLNMPYKKASWELDPNRETAYQHYKSILLSDNAQSLIIEQNRKQIIQFDLFPLGKSNPVFRASHDEIDCYLHYLFRENFRDHNLFKKGLTCLLGYLFSHPKIGLLYLRLIQPEPALTEILQDLGFEPAGSKIHFQISRRNLNL